jgi:hypothetical protein
MMAKNVAKNVTKKSVEADLRTLIAAKEKTIDAMREKMAQQEEAVQNLEDEQTELYNALISLGGTQ